MKNYRVIVREDAFESDCMRFDCQAEDEAHARDQAQNAYPEAVIIGVYLEPEPKAPKLCPGDEWFWQDPDGGLSSGYKTISEVRPDGIVLCTDGMEAFAHEFLPERPEAQYAVLFDPGSGLDKEFCGRAQSIEEAAKCCADRYFLDQKEFFCKQDSKESAFICRVGKPQIVELTLKLKVSYLPNSSEEEALRNQLLSAVDFLVDQGLLTGDTDAEVAAHQLEVY